MRGLLTYYEGDSFLHRRNPALKLLSALVMMAAAVLAFDPWTPLALLVVGLAALTIAGRVPLRAAARPLLVFLVLGALGLLGANAFFYRPVGGHVPSALWQAGPLRLTAAGLRVGISLTLRMLAIAVVSIAFVATTPPTDLVLSLVQNARFPYRLGYGILVAYRFLPMWRTEMGVIRAAHRIRGVGRQRGQAWRRYAVPLLAGAIRKAERVATAMDSKAFGAARSRTYFRRMRVTAADWAMLAATVVVTAGILLVLARAGRLEGFGAIPPD
jgi:energy-coupling factor transport system permease protein